MSDFFEKNKKFKNTFIRSKEYNIFLDQLNLLFAQSSTFNLLSQKNTLVYSLGEFNSEFLCLRIPKKAFKENNASRLEVETFCKNSEDLFSKGNRNFSQICLPVSFLNLFGSKSYALIVEDLTQNNKWHFPENISGNVENTRINVQNPNIRENMFVDLGPRSYRMFSELELTMFYTLPENSINLCN